MRRYLISGIAITAAGLALAPVAKAQAPAAPDTTPGQPTMPQQDPGQAPPQPTAPAQEPPAQEPPAQEAPTQEPPAQEAPSQPMTPDPAADDASEPSYRDSVSDLDPTLGPLPRTGQVTLHNDKADVSGTGEVTINDLLIYNRLQRGS
ncbi:hypothetical protein [Nodosilinea sp. P-1105]|uniref:hypothetical protein n=1 Tax=Nodosilinea sp. P-1105 TaxID=2546229 RepID=UPI00146B2D15|nr:hypothetical protein [Nodosilinea sp. P-1105]NMF86803.1 hypothetical protein [Nodosilinea sp. P-1105]